jgi:acyl carrier protein
LASGSLSVISSNDYQSNDSRRDELEIEFSRACASNEKNEPPLMKNIETFYPLSPVQQGMLSDALRAPGSDACIEQSHWTLLADLDVEAFERAWQRVIDRHAVLRSSFIWEGVSEPIQVVHKKVGLPLIKEDWRGLSSHAQQERISSFLEMDKARDFNLAEPPLMRLALIQSPDQQFEFVWTRHHLLLDGWSGSLLINEVFSFYEAFRNGGDLNLDQSRPYRDYVAWLRKQDLAAAETFWRKTLSGFTGPTSLRIERQSQAKAEREKQFAEQQINLSLQTTAALQSLSRQRQITLNTIAQGAWALLLSRYSGENDVVFGSVVSGRDAELDGIESILGPFANILPVRVKVAPGADLTSWLRQLQSEQTEQRRYGHTPLAQVQQLWNDAPQGHRLFDTILAFENHPLAARLQGQEQFLEAYQLTYSVRTHYPITVTVIPAAQWRISIAYDARQFHQESMMRMLSHFQALLEAMAKDSSHLPVDVPALTPDISHAADGPASINKLRRLSSDDKPGYIISSAFVFMDHLPHSPNGKVNRKSLHASDATRPEMEQGFTPPRNRVEEAIADIWAQALGISQVGIHDSFYELGGHSLMATQIISRLSERFELELPLRALFENPSVAQLACEIARMQDQKDELENEQLLDMLEQLSDEEVQAALKQRTDGRD